MKRTKLGRLGAIVCMILSFVLVFSLVACGGKSGGGNNNGAKLTLDKNTVSVEVDKTATVSVTSAISGEVTWSISPAGKATVTASGTGKKLATIKGVEAGTATLTAKVGDKTATCTVTVTAKQDEGGDELDTAIRGKYNMYWLGDDGDDELWSQVEQVLEIKADGATLGEGTLKCEKDGDLYHVTGDELDLYAAFDGSVMYVFDAKDKAADKHNAIYVAIKGDVSSEVRQAIKTATGKDLQEYIVIKTNGEEINNNSFSLYMDSAILNARTFTAVGSLGSAVTWESEDAEIATVSESGVVTAVAAGDTTVTAKIGDDLEQILNIKVVAAGTSFDFSDAKPMGWSFWHGKPYGHGDGEVTRAVYYSDNAAEITFDVTTTKAVPYTVQLHYNTAELKGTSSGVELTVVSPKAGDIFINDEKVTVKVGDNKVKIEEYDAEALYFQIGVAEDEDAVAITGENLTFLFKDIVFTDNVVTTLVAPSFEINSDTKVITITDEQNDADDVEKYELGFFADEQATAPIKAITVTDEEVVNLESVDSGDYYVRIRAVNSVGTIRDSAWSTSGVAFKVENENTNLKPNTSPIAKGTWVYYSEGGAGCTSAVIDSNNNIVLTGYSAPDDANWWCFQLIYTPQEGKTLTGISFNITSTGAGSITAAVNGTQSAASTVALTKDPDSDVYITASPIERTGLSVTDSGTFVIWLCGYDDTTSRLSGDITISNINYTYAE